MIWVKLSVSVCANGTRHQNVHKITIEKEEKTTIIIDFCLSWEKFYLANSRKLIDPFQHDGSTNEKNNMPEMLF